MTTGPQINDGDVDEVVAFLLRAATRPVGQSADQADIVAELARGYARLKWPAMSEEWVEALAHRVRQRVMWSQPAQPSHDDA